MVVQGVPPSTVLSDFVLSIRDIPPTAWSPLRSSGTSMSHLKKLLTAVSSTFFSFSFCIKSLKGLSSSAFCSSTGFVRRVVGLGGLSLPGDGTPLKPPSKLLDKIFLKERDHSSNLDLGCLLESSDHSFCSNRRFYWYNWILTFVPVSGSIVCSWAYTVIAPAAKPLLKTIVSLHSADSLDRTVHGHCAIHGRFLSIRDSSVTHLSEFSLRRLDS